MWIWGLLDDAGPLSVAGRMPGRRGGLERELNPVREGWTRCNLSPDSLGNHGVISGAAGPYP